MWTGNNMWPLQYANRECVSFFQTYNYNCKRRKELQMKMIDVGRECDHLIAMFLGIDQEYQKNADRMKVIERGCEEYLSIANALPDLQKRCRNCHYELIQKMEFYRQLNVENARLECWIERYS